MSNKLGNEPTNYISKQETASVNNKNTNSITQHFNKNNLPLILWQCAIYAVPLIIAIYSIWYWNSTYEQLIQFYKSLNSTFYNASIWSDKFFTATVKQQGNWWCLIALIAAIVWTVLVRKSKPFVLPKLSLKKNSLIIYSIIIIIGTALSYIANVHLRHGTDEIFSAYNFASLPAFQCLSYYALPNNHILFNFLNGINKFWCDDLVITGRIFSLICYVLTLCITWNFMQKWIQSILLRSFALLLLAVQLPVWGFSSQARGYEFLLLLNSFF